MCMHWLKYVRLKKKDRLKNIRGTTLEVVMLHLANVSGAYSAISSVYQYVTGPGDMSLCHSRSVWMYLTLIGQQNVNGAVLESCRFVVDNKFKMSIYQSL